MRIPGLSCGLAFSIFIGRISPHVVTHFGEFPLPPSIQTEALALPSLPNRGTFDAPGSRRLDAGLGRALQEAQWSGMQARQAAGTIDVSFIGRGISTHDLKSIHLSGFPALYRQGLLTAVHFLEDRLRLERAIINPTAEEKGDREILANVIRFIHQLLDRQPDQFGLFCARIVSQKNYLLEFATSRRVGISGELLEATYRERGKLGEILFVMAYGHLRPGRDLDEYQARLRGIRLRLFGDKLLADDIQTVLRQIVFIDNMGAFYHDAGNLLTGVLGMLSHVKEGLPEALKAAAEDLLTGPVADLVQQGDWLKELHAKYRMDRRADQFNAMRRDAELAEAQFARFQQTLKNPEISRTLDFIRRSLTPQQAENSFFLPDLARLTNRMLLLGSCAASFQNILAHRNYRGDTSPVSVAETIEMVRGSFDQSEFSIRLRQSSLGVKIQAYMPHIIRIWENLFTNSQHAGASEVKVTVSKRNHRAVVRVSDNGKGISSTDLPHIYQPGFSRRGSTGIGLAITRRIVEAIKGTIGVESTVDKGTTFIFSWPLTGDSSNDPPANSEPVKRRSRGLAAASPPSR